MARHVSPITQPGHRAGVPNPNKGKTFPVEILTRLEVLDLIDANNCGLSGLRDRAEIATGWGTGARVSELLGLRVWDVNFETGAVRINGTKTKNAVRTVGLNPGCRAPRGHHRVWCYECRADLIEWPPNDWGPRWNVMDPNDPESAVIVPREDFHRLRSGKPSR